MKPEELEETVATVLKLIAGLDTTKTDQTDTPRRYIDMLGELTKPVDFDFTMFPNEGDVIVDEMIVASPIPFASLCAHHVIPFTGVAHVGYVPKKRVAGLSKLARTVKNLSKGLWMQEYLTTEIAHFLDDTLQPLGTAVVMQAEHLCMTIRGVQTPGTITTTSCMLGCFRDPTEKARDEFLAFVRDNGRTTH